MTRFVSPIYGRGPSDPLTGQAAEQRNAEVFQRLWRERGLIVIDPAAIFDDWLRQALINHAEKQYGRGR